MTMHPPGNPGNDISALPSLAPSTARGFADRMLAELETDLGVHHDEPFLRMSRLRLQELRNALQGLLSLSPLAAPKVISQGTAKEIMEALQDGIESKGPNSLAGIAMESWSREAAAVPASVSHTAPRAEGGDWIDSVVLDICEIPDRTSPDDEPEIMLVKASELRQIIEAHAPRSTPAPLYRPREEYSAVWNPEAEKTTPASPSSTVAPNIEELAKDADYAQSCVLEHGIHIVELKTLARRIRALSARPPNHGEVCGLCGEMKPVPLDVSAERKP